MGFERRKLMSQIATISLIIVSVICCLCGTINSLSVYIPNPDEIVEPFVLPNGEIATDEDVSQISAVGLAVTFLLSSAIFILGAAVLLVFRQERKNLLATVAIAMLLYGSLVIVLWTILMVFFAPITEGMLGVTFVGAIRPTWGSILFCWSLASILALLACCIWYFFIKDAIARPIENKTENLELSLNRYLQFVDRVLEENKVAISLNILQSRTDILFAKIPPADKVRAIIYLYQTGLLLAGSPHVLEKIDLTAVDLSGLELPKIYLVEANLSHAKLSDINLSSAVLTKANFTDADLRSANLCKSSLVHCNLRNAKLHRGNLSHTDLTGANLTNTNLWSVNLHASNLTQMQADSAKTLAHAILPNHIINKHV